MSTLIPLNKSNIRSLFHRIIEEVSRLSLWGERETLVHTLVHGVFELRRYPGDVRGFKPLVSEKPMGFPFRLDGPAIYLDNSAN